MVVMILLSAISFLFFGIGCFFDRRMKLEFIRYGLDKQRPLVGLLQVIGGLGLVVGYWYLPVLGFVASIGLSLLMLLGFGVRLKIRDSFWQSVPSLGYAVLNAYLAYRFFVNLDF